MVSVVLEISYVTPAGSSLTVAVCAPSKSNTIGVMVSPSQNVCDKAPLLVSCNTLGVGLNVSSPEISSSLQLPPVVVMV